MLDAGFMIGLENGCLGYQVNRKSGGRLSRQQDIRIIAILDTGCSLVRSELNPPRRIKCLPAVPELRLGRK